MLSPEYIDHLPDRVVELYADLEIRILEDMARRISKTGALTETAQSGRNGNLSDTIYSALPGKPRGRLTNCL